MLATDRSDLVVAVSPSLSGLAASVLARRGRPLAAVVQDLNGSGAAESGTTGSRAARLIAAAEYALLRRADAVGVVADGFAAAATEHGVDPAAVVDVRNFTHIEPSGATREEARSWLGWRQDRYTVVHTGNMGRKQGLEVVIDAARDAGRYGPDFDLVLVGDGNARASLEQHARGLSNVHFVDPLPEADYPLALAAADVLVVNERVGVKEMSLPSKLTSYASASRPIVAAVEPGGATFRELSREGAAVLVEPGSAHALVDGITRVRKDPEVCDGALRGAAALHGRTGRGAAVARYVGLVEMLARRSPRVRRRG